MKWEKKLKEMNVLAVGFFSFLFEGKNVFLIYFFIIHFLKRFSKIFYGIQ